MAYINVVATTANSIRVQIAGLQTDYAQSDRVCVWYLDGAYEGVSYLEGGISAGGDYIFSGLEPGCEYSISVSITAPGWDFTVDLDTYAETDEPSVEPWDWYSSNGSASASQTRAAYDAVTSRGSLGDFSYLVWNDMVDKVNEAAVASGDSWITTYDTLANTKMSTVDKTLTATRFNSLRLNIGARVSTGITERKSGDTVYGSYFTTLIEKLNDWIERI